MAKGVLRFSALCGMISLYGQECFVCNQRDAGACVKCADCNKFFHVSCAWSSNFKFAFEIHPVKKKKQVQQVSITFKTETGASILFLLHLKRLKGRCTGAMEPKIWCKSHRLKPDRLVYDFQEKDPETMLVRRARFMLPMCGTDTRTVGNADVRSLLQDGQACRQSRSHPTRSST